MRLLLLMVSGALAALTGANEFDALETATKDNFLTTKIDLRVCIKDESSGNDIPSPTLTLMSWSGGTETEMTSPAASEGCFDLTNISRGAVHIKIEAPNYYTSVTPVDLHISTDIVSVDLGYIALTKKRDGVARLVFGGDVMFERRFFSKGLLHLGASFEEEMKALFRYIQPILEIGDHTSVNLECPIVGDRSTLHTTKNIVFGCYRASAEALSHVGIDSVTIANNH